jgi:hypothetical protein
MINNPIFDIAISMILIFALLSVLVSILNEWVSHRNNRRSIMLRQSILKILKDPHNLDYGELFFNHLSIETISKVKPTPWYNVLNLLGKKQPPKKLAPQYISASMFADVVIDVIAAQAQHSQKLIPAKDNDGKIILDATGKKTYLPQGDSPASGLNERFVTALSLMNPSPFNDMLKGYLDRAGGDMAKVKASLETWFNDYMDRVSGWYKGKQRNKLLIMGFIVAIFLNVDSLHLIKTLSLDDKLRDQLVANAEIVADNYESLSDSLKSDISTQINLFKIANDSIAKLSEVKAIDSKKPTTLVKYLNEKYPEHFKKFTDMIIGEDSLSKVYMNQMDEVLGIAASLNLPIGYNSYQAPLSWFNKGEIKKDTSSKNDGLMKYNYSRNKGLGWAYFKYIIGICITAFSLSFGAPFWFDLLVKFVNIRRSGIKPTDTKTTKN